jgi:ligand-binding sensor domain-containing protein
VGTEQGLLRLDRRRDEWKQFTADDGLLGEEVQILLLEGDALWIGTSEGLTRYRWSEDFFESN